MTGRDVGGRRHASGVDLLDFLRVREDVAELPREQIELRRGEREVCQGRDGFHLRSRESGGHGKC